MDLFVKGDGVKLRSHLDKYLAADDDSETVRQSRNGDSRRAVWTVESVVDKPNLIRLRSCHGTYLTASNTPFLLGMTGEKVVQTASSNKPSDWQTQWEPVPNGFQVKMRSWCGKWLRANGGSPPWRNSVTHDEPHTSKTKDWVLWDVIVVDGDHVPFGDDVSACSTPTCSSRLDGSDPGSPASVGSMKSLGRLSFGSPMSPRWTPKSRTCSNLGGEVSAMEFFQKAKAVRMRSVHDKYLTADEDEETVGVDRNGSSKNARWVVEPVQGSYHVIRLRSCHGKYLTASTQRFLLGATGRKVVQTKPSQLDSSVEWEPMREGSKIRLRTRHGKYLRANGGVPPWRNSVTHDVPHRSATQDWILWDVDMVEILVEPNSKSASPPQPQRSDSPVSMSYSGSSTPSSVSAKSDHLFGQESKESTPNSPPKQEGRRTVYYHVADEMGNVEDESTVGYAFTFKGKSVEQLMEALREETSMEDAVVCTRSPLNGKLFPLRLQLPPNNTTMHVVLVPSTSRLARDFTSGLKL